MNCYTTTVYTVLVSYEAPMPWDFDPTNRWESIELPLPVETYDPELARVMALRKLEAHLEKKYPMCSRDSLNIEIKSVTELPQTVYMQRIGAPQLFAMAA